MAGGENHLEDRSPANSQAGPQGLRPELGCLGVEGAESPRQGGPDSGKWERSSDTLRAAREGGRGV